MYKRCRIYIIQSPIYYLLSLNLFTPVCNNRVVRCNIASCCRAACLRSWCVAPNGGYFGYILLDTDTDLYFPPVCTGSGSVDPYVSLGCWRDTADRAIPVLEGTDPRLDNRYYPARQNPIEKCYLVAFDRGFRVFAVQDDGQCFGSADAHNTYKKYGPSTACAADGEGGPWANEVYQITAPFEDICLGTTTCDRSAGASCRAWGDPHYISFDGTRTDFMGTCTYTLAERTEEPAFRVAAKNEHRYGRTHVSYISRVTVEVYAHRITVSRNNRVSVNDVPVTLPACIGNNVGVRMTGRDVLIYTDFCLRVTYDGNHDVNLEVPSDLIGQSRGMCGNFNGDRTDDRQLPDGNLTTSQAAFGDSWKVVNITDESCPVEDTPEITFDLSQADDALVQAIESTSQCGKMLDPSGPFGDCLEVVDPTDYYEACVFDMAFHEGTVPELLCESTQAYSDACVEKGVPQPSWRTDSFCPMQCPAMSEYAQCVSPCPATCADLQAAEKCSPTEPCVEGCRCLVGFVLSGDVCVPADACGCFTEGRYHSLNEEWSEGDQLCWCDQSRDIRCVQMSNAPEETTFVNGTSEEAPPTDVTTTEATTTTAQPGRVSEEAFAMLECTGEYMQVVFSRSHIPEFDKDHLHLMDPSCKATGNATHIILTAPFDECGTVKTVSTDPSRC
ncbi:zonadhesin-like [Branchiostoma floridae x Branchiostoma japonicum]